MATDAVFTQTRDALTERTACVVASMVREAIAEGRVRPGDSLSEAALADELGVARPTLREAFQMLESEGLLTVGARGDAMIRALDPVELENMYTLRAVLEGHAAARAATRLSPAALEELRRSCDRFSTLAAAPRPDLNVLVSENRNFHMLIIEAADDTRLASMTRQLVDVPLVHLVYLWHSREQRDHAQRCHHEVTDCLARRDAAAAEAAMRAHVLATRDLVIAHQAAGEQGERASSQHA